MPDGQSLEFSGVTKRFGAVTAVSDLSARVEPGRVTGFLGPNGAGKTTTLRILLGLVRATSGHATIGGRRYAELGKPLQTVGAVLEASSFHPGRTGAAHLTIYAQAAGIPRGRVDEVLGLVGLGDAGGRKVGGYSLGMRQRLGLAYALLGDPGVLVLDEPANGLDPEGIRWMRGFLRQLAAEGRTVLVSSHLLAEVQQTVDALLIISRGRLVFEGSIDDLADPTEYATVVDAPDRDALTAALSAAGLPYEVLRSGLTVRGADPTAVGAAAAASGVALSALQRRGPALEEVFLDLVNGTRVHASAAGGSSMDAAAPGTGSVEAASPEPAAAPTQAAPVEGAAVEGAAVEAAPVEVAPVEGAEAEAAPVEAGAEAAPGEAAPVVAGVALAAAGGMAAGRETDDEAREADESALAAAELDAEAAGAPGAAAALGAAAGAAWTDERDRDADTFDPAPTAEEPVAAEAGEPAAEEPVADQDSAADIPPVTEPTGGPAVTTGAGFAVASTGVIDIVPTASEPESDRAPQSDSAPESESEPQFESAREREAAAEAPPEDADPDVEEIGVIDDELSTPEPPDEDDDRPWENYVKTDADVEADAFFAAFDSGDDEPSGVDQTDDEGVSSPGTGESAVQRPDDDPRPLSERGTSETKRPDDTDDPGPRDPAAEYTSAAAGEPDEGRAAAAPRESADAEDAQVAASAPSPDDETEHEGGER
ncbi:ABC transporter ATP-binding protein [Microbacterium kyungheense]|uniref:ABC-type multidrug transport system ATPase subunit n=1 Tax=Microbacterium kyungheense TaxID=1263636 RepID=A0A543EQH4_9MICO|nr:ABC-type multidrug transport system ATPase subunit [Microbacterium kyungheense]